MTFVRSFADFEPPERFDGLPFTEAVIEESAEEAGTFTAIETIALDPLDSDPADPRARSFTTAKATLDPAWYRIVWKDAAGAAFVGEPVFFAAVSTTYATPTELRQALNVTTEMLPTDEAARMLREAEDLIDERLGARPVDPDTGRKVIPGDEDAWRVAKLREATLEIAKAIFEDPDVARRQRARYVSGDVSTNGFYGPAYGERCEALIQTSGLRVNRARMRGGRQRPLRRFR